MMAKPCTGVAMLGLLVVLSACGADGPPERPEPRQDRPEPGITLSGKVEVGISGGHSKIEYGR